jgi:CheY-like chemotaxis protein
MKILLALSDDLNFQNISSGLTRRGFDIIHVKHADELESVYAAGTLFDLLLFSTNLPGLLSFDPVIKGRNLYPETPFFLFMSEISLQSMRLAEFLKFNEVIRNPVEFTDLEQLIIKHLQALQ